MTATAACSADDVRRRLRTRSAVTPDWTAAQRDTRPIRLTGQRLELQRRLCRELATIGFPNYDTDDPADPACLQTAAGVIGTMPVIGSAVMTAQEVGRLLEYAPEAHTLGVRVEIGPGDEPRFLRLTFHFA